MKPHTWIKLSQENSACIIRCIDQSYFPNISQLQQSLLTSQATVNKSQVASGSATQLLILNSDHTLKPPEDILENTDAQAPAAPESICPQRNQYCKIKST